MVTQKKVYITFGQYAGRHIRNLPQKYRLWLLREGVVTTNKNEELWEELIKQIKKYKSKEQLFSKKKFSRKKLSC